MAKKKRRKQKQKVNWSVVIAAAILLSAFTVVTLFNGKDWSKWLPDGDSLPPRIFTGSSLSDVPDADVLVHYIDVGQGDSMLIQAGDANILIDAGENDMAGEVVAYLNSVGVDTLDMVVGSHPHSDHIGGMDVVIDTFDVKQVIMGDVPKAIIPTTRTYTDVLKAVKNKGLTVTLAHAGDSYEIGGGTLSVLGPVETYYDLNSTSLVMKFTYGDVSFLFTGDQEADAEKELVASGADVSATVLKLGHHGSSTSSSEEFLDAVGAECYVIQVGEGNKYNHPHAEIREKLKKTGKPVYRTDLNGDIVIATDGKTFDVYTGK